MKLSLAASPSKADILFIGLFEKEALSPVTKKQIGEKASKLIQARLKAKDFEGKAGQSLTVYPEDNKFGRVVFMGRGKKSKQGIQAMEKLGATCAGIAQKSKAKNAEAILKEDDLSDFANGFALGAYTFDQYKEKKKDEVKLSSLTLVTKENKKSKEALKDAQVFLDASALTRDLVNMPAGDMTPSDLEKRAKEVANKHKLKITVLDEKKLKSLGCGGLIGVGRGAEVPPRMIIIEYKHRSTSKNPNIAFLGKGITFDTGGLNLKPTGYMETMKQDMAGAATVLGACQAIAHAKLSGHFLFVMSVAENAVSDRSIRPGDVLKAYNGKTIEVTNTDAEGRLVLADALSYTEDKYKPKVMLNIATLTGAVSVALGYHITGVMGNDKKLIKESLEAAESAHERLWELPLDDDFVEATKGSFTDIKNSSDGVRAGSSMGGAFLKNFVAKTKWAHFDIGGTAWADKPTARTKYGSTAVMLRTFFEMAKRHSS